MIKSRLVKSLIPSILAIFYSAWTMADKAVKDKEIPNPMSFSLNSKKEGNHLTTLYELQNRETEYLNSRWRRDFLTMAGTVHSYLGNYRDAILYFDKIRALDKVGNEIDIPMDKSFNMNLYKPVNAVAAINNIAEAHRVIFINEAHHIPMHRAFSIRLLKGLYDKGFRYFAAETLEEDGDTLNNRKFPRITSGAYISEPVYGDLVRTALKLGYKIIPYDTKEKCDFNEKGILYCQNKREKAQAENLVNRILKKDPSAKILVHAGYGHIDEKGSDDGWIPMGRYFKEMTEIDPFTIDQTTMTEHSSPDYEAPEYRYAADKHLLEDSAIFMSDNKDIWVHAGFRGHYDAQIFHPRAEYKHGRPNWLSFQGERQAFPLKGKWCKEVNPCLVRAFLAQEDDPQAVPIDQIVLSNTETSSHLMLPKGKFRIQAVDKDSTIINTFTTEID